MVTISEDLSEDAVSYLSSRLVDYSEKSDIIISAIKASTYSEAKDEFIDDIVDNASEIVGKDVHYMAFGLDMKKINPQAYGALDCVYTDSEGKVGAIRFYTKKPKDRDVRKHMKRIKALGFENEPIALYLTTNEEERTEGGYKIIGRGYEAEKDESFKIPFHTSPATVSKVKEVAEAQKSLRHHLGQHNTFICIDDAYKEHFGKDMYIRIAAIKFDRSEDLTLYGQGNYEKISEKVRLGEMLQYDLIVTDTDHNYDSLIKEKALEAIVQLADGEAVDIYACNFFKKSLGEEDLEITFGSGHKKNDKYKQFVKTADKATKWEPVESREPIDFINDLRSHWRAHRNNSSEDEFDFQGRHIYVSKMVSRKK